MGRTTRANRSLGADPQRPRRPARRGQKPVRRLDRPLPPAHRRHESRRRQAVRRRPRLPPQHRRRRLPPPRPRRPGQQGELLDGMEPDAHLRHRGRRRLHKVRRHPRRELLPRRSRQPALHHRQGLGGEPGLPRPLRKLLRGTYALSVPFAERFFNLACRSAATGAAPATSARSRPTPS